MAGKRRLLAAPFLEQLGGLPVREGLNQAERASRGVADYQPSHRIEVVDTSPAPRIAGLFRLSSTCRGRLGVRVQPVTDDLAERFRLDDATGAPVARVVTGPRTGKIAFNVPFAEVPRSKHPLWRDHFVAAAGNLDRAFPAGTGGSPSAGSRAWRLAALASSISSPSWVNQVNHENPSRR